jgi:hypothetical protein
VDKAFKGEGLQRAVKATAGEDCEAGWGRGVGKSVVIYVEGGVRRGGVIRKERPESYRTESAGREVGEAEGIGKEGVKRLKGVPPAAEELDGSTKGLSGPEIDGKDLRFTGD